MLTASVNNTKFVIGVTNHSPIAYD